MTALAWAPQQAWQPPPPATLHGELTADGQDIILIAEAGDYGLKQIVARLRRLTPEIAAVAGEQALRIPATWAAVVQLGFTFNGLPGFSWEPQPRLNEWAIAETIRRTSERGPLPENLWPEGLIPRSYQIEAARAIAEEGRFLLLDEPGTGKTISSLLGLEARRRNGTGIWPMIITVPSWDVGDVWAREIATWMPHWPEPVLHRGPKRYGRTGKIRTAEKKAAGILITTYATLRADADTTHARLVRLQPAAVVADEIHVAGNPHSLQSAALRRIARHAGTVVGASGTPVDRNTGDAYPLLEAMDPRSWPSRERFVKRYCARIEGPYDEKITGLDPGMAAEFFAIMDRNMRRVAKADVLDQLPPKVYSVRRPEIPPEWAGVYRQLDEDMLAVLPDGTELGVMTTLVKLMRLSQVASCAADVEVTEVISEITGMPEPRYEVTLKAPCWKADVLFGIMAERPGEPVACFTASRQLAMVTSQLARAQGLRVGHITGIGDGVTRGSRKADIAAFQAGKLDLIIGTARAAGLGITLTRAGTVVFLQRDWRLGEGTQPEDRAQRIGAEMFHDKIEIIDVVAKGTVEDRVRARLREKAGQLGEFIRDPRYVREILGGIK